ncbi:hypothetical protein [Candidatus Pseudoruminococcus sp.]|uniref:hypothetical protein n=1 Tax=Candidatus Pseudoruminococcus sp. TaxID=3101048 RepID=UPI0039998BFF
MKKFNRLLLITGLVLILSLLLLLIFNLQKFNKSDENLSIIAEKIEKLIPKKSEVGVSNSFACEMPSIEIDGCDFIGLIEVPSYGIKLPIYSEFEEYMPKVYSGSIYNYSLIIEGRYLENQFNFADKIEVREQIIFTDLYGNVFRYKVKRITHSDNINSEKFQSDNQALTIFVKYNSSYIIIYSE